MRTTKSLEAAFMAHVSPEPNTGCWLWAGNVHSAGYGLFKGIKANPWRGLAHRASMWILEGVNPGDFQVLHRCDNKACVNPAHLYLGTHTDNMRDAAIRLRHRRKLRPEDVRFAVNSLRTGGTPTSIAKSLGVTPRAIYSILSGKSWRHFLETEGA